MWNPVSQTQTFLIENENWFSLKWRHKISTMTTKPNDQTKIFFVELKPQRIIYSVQCGAVLLNVKWSVFSVRTLTVTWLWIRIPWASQSDNKHKSSCDFLLPFYLLMSFLFWTLSLKTTGTFCPMMSDHKCPYSFIFIDFLFVIFAAFSFWTFWASVGCSALYVALFSRTGKLRLTIRPFSAINEPMTHSSSAHLSPPAAQLAAGNEQLQQRV